MTSEIFLQVTVNYSLSSSKGGFEGLAQVGISVIFQSHMPPIGSQRLVASCVLFCVRAAVDGASAPVNLPEFPWVKLESEVFTGDWAPISSHLRIDA